VARACRLARARRGVGVRRSVAFAIRRVCRSGFSKVENSAEFFKEKNKMD